MHNYKDEAEQMTPEQVEMLLRGMDAIADSDASLRPGHVAYISKAEIISLAKMTMHAVRELDAES